MGCSEGSALVRCSMVVVVAATMIRRELLCIISTYDGGLGCCRGKRLTRHSVPDDGTSPLRANGKFEPHNRFGPDTA